MNYQSTRNFNLSVKSAEAIKLGIAPDGGLFVPCDMPHVSEDELLSFKDLSYVEIANCILSKFLTDYTAEEIKDCTSKAYTANKFGSDKIAPVHKINDTEYVLELWHGPTCAFKDMALQILPHFLTKAIKKTGEDKNVIILVATSGDTGKAALEGFKNVSGTKIQVFYPKNGVSDIQKLQMVTQDGNNVSVVAVEGNFDDAQTGVKKVFSNPEYNKEAAELDYVFSSANSINWGRLVPQIVYYFASYASLLADNEIKCGDKINIVVPTGNFGNILAAYYAMNMGLPVKKLICASNSNNVLTDFIKTGVYDRNRDFETTISPSMDILISSNLERLLFLMSDRNSEIVKNHMQSLSENGKYEISDDMKKKLKTVFYGGFCSDEDTKKTIKQMFDKYGYTMDTHTAVAQNVYQSYLMETGDNTKTVIASTANPYKFNESVLSAINPEKSFDDMNEFELLEALKEKSGMEIPKSLSELKNKFVRFNASCKKDNLWDEIRKFLTK